MTAAISLLAAALLFAAAAFQIALAAGAPVGHLAYGGRAAEPGQPLPQQHRIASAAALVVILGMAAVLLDRGGWVTVVPAGSARTLTALVAGFMAVNTIGNLAGKHWIERFVMGGITAAVAACAGWLAWAPLP